MGKTHKKLEGDSAGPYKRTLRKEKRINLHYIANQLGQGNYDAEVDYLGTLYNANVDYDLHNKIPTPYARRKREAELSRCTEITTN